MRDSGLGTAADEAPLEVPQVVANAVKAHVNLLVLPVVVRLLVGLLVCLVVAVLLLLGHVLRAGQVAGLVELALPPHFIFHQVRHQLVDNILHCAVEADVLQRMGLMDDILAGWTSVIFLQVFHQATFAKRMKTFSDSCCINEVAFANFACYVFVQRFQFDPSLHGRARCQDAAKFTIPSL